MVGLFMYKKNILLVFLLQPFVDNREERDPDRYVFTYLSDNSASYAQ